MKHPQGTPKWSESWLFRWIVNNQAVTILLALLLIFLNLFMFTKISFILTPIANFIGIVLLPVVLAGLLYYLLNPIVDFLETKKIPRLAGIILVFVMIILLLIWGIIVLVPNIQTQVSNLAINAPIYLSQLSHFTEKLLQDSRLIQYNTEIEQVLNNLTSQAIVFVRNFSSNLFGWVGSFVGAASQVIMAILIMPFILFYLLRDGKNLRRHLTKLLPTTWRQPVGQILTDVNTQLANYVRGQVTVAAIVAILFSILFSIIGLRYAVTLGVIAGVLNLVPYLGSFLAMIPAVILAVIDSPFMLLKVLIVFMVEQTIEGRFVSPLILGSQLQIHPLTILFVLLTAGQTMGVWGVLLGIPVYASCKVVLTAIFRWYTKYSSLYDDEVHDEEIEEIVERLNEIE